MPIRSEGGFARGADGYSHTRRRIGPDLTDSVKEVIGALDVGIEWEIAEAGEAVMDREGTPLPESVLESIRRNKVAIKGP
jgi:isocitrate dehydrogenase (NAD+)